MQIEFPFLEIWSWERKGFCHSLLNTEIVTKHDFLPKGVNTQKEVILCRERGIKQTVGKEKE